LFHLFSERSVLERLVLDYSEQCCVSCIGFFRRQFFLIMGSFIDFVDGGYVEIMEYVCLSQFASLQSSASVYHFRFLPVLYEIRRHGGSKFSLSH